MAAPSDSDINTTFNHGKGNSDLFQFEESKPQLSEAEQYADDLARELINDTDKVVKHEHSQLLDLSGEAMETAPALIGTDISQEQLHSVATPEMVDDNADLLSFSQDSLKSSKPSAVVANTPLYFEEDSLNDSRQKSDEDEAKKEVEKEVKEEEEAKKEVEEEAEEEEIKEEPKEEVKEDVKEEAETDVIEDIEDEEKEEVKVEVKVEVKTEVKAEVMTKYVEEEEKENKEEQQLEQQQQQQKDVDEEEVAEKLVDKAMEFTKNYSDDLLMDHRSGESNQRGSDDIGGGAAGGGSGPDLADFELPPYSGSSSSGSEQAAITTTSPLDTQKHQSPAGNQDRKPSSSSSSSSSRQQSTTTAAAASSVSVPDLTALKKLITSSYSKVSHVFHWKKPIESGIFFATGLTVIIALTFFSIISVAAYSGLGIILASGLIRLYKSSMKALNRPSETPVDHIWEKVLNLNVSMSSDKMHELIDASHANINSSLVYIKQVLLVEDKFSTFKFGFILYLLTYIGAWFNGLTLITICYLSLFSIPLVYEKNKTKIDEYLNLATKQVFSTISMVTNRVTTIAFGPSSGDSKKQN